MLVNRLSEFEKFDLLQDTLINLSNNDFTKWYIEVERLYKELVEHTKFEYRQYQVDYAAMTCLRRRNILAHSQGAGKTITSGLVIASIYKDIKATSGRVHILVPNILAAHRWLEDLSCLPSINNCIKYINTTKQLDKAKEQGVSIYIYTYEFLKKRYRDKNLAKYFSKYERPSMVIIDEVHNLANNEADRVQKVNTLTRRVKRVIGLTGTISDGRLEQISSICNLIYRGQWIYNNRNFVKSFGKKRKLETNYLTGDTESSNRYLNNLDPGKVSDYYDLIRGYLHRVTLDDPVVKSSINLPLQVNHLIEIELEPEIKFIYDSYISKYKTDLEIVAKSNPNGIARFQAFKLISPLISIVNAPPIESVKIQVIKKYLNKYKKVAIFTHRIESARYLEDNLSKDFETVRLYSQDEYRVPRVLPTKDRYEVVKKFQLDPSIRVGIFSVGLAAESIDLTSADAVFFYCLPWQSVKILQSISRVVRPGNPNPKVNLLYFYYSNAIDRHQVNLALRKIQNTKTLLDYDGIEVTEDDNNSDLNPHEVLQDLLKLI
jgi:superfamily II DNA or RNA helicase